MMMMMMMMIMMMMMMIMTMMTMVVVVVGVGMVSVIGVKFGSTRFVHGKHHGDFKNKTSYRTTLPMCSCENSTTHLTPKAKQNRTKKQNKPTKKNVATFCWCQTQQIDSRKDSGCFQLTKKQVCLELISKANSGQKKQSNELNQTNDISVVECVAEKETQ